MACIKRVQEKKNIKPPPATSRRSSIFRSATAPSAASVAPSAVMPVPGRTGGKKASVAIPGPRVPVVGTAKTELDQLHQLALLKGLKCNQYIAMVSSAGVFSLLNVSAYTVTLYRLHRCCRHMYICSLTSSGARSLIGM